MKSPPYFCPVPAITRFLCPFKKGGAFNAIRELGAKDLVGS